MKKLMLVGVIFCTMLFVMSFTSKGFENKTKVTINNRLIKGCDCSEDADVKKYYKLVTDKVDVQCNTHKFKKAVLVCQKECQTTEDAKKTIQERIDAEDDIIEDLCE